MITRCNHPHDDTIFIQGPVETVVLIRALGEHKTIAVNQDSLKLPNHYDDPVLDRNKRWADILGYLKLLCKKHDWHLILVGEGPSFWDSYASS